MEQREKREKLYALAEQDDVYNVWKNGFEDCVQPFWEFVSKQPKDVQKILCGYADCGRMMMQRIINIACEKMEFVKDRK